MAQVNDSYGKLQAGYLFPEIGRRVQAFQDSQPDAAIIRLGIGDVTLPLAAAVVDALHAAVDEIRHVQYGMVLTLIVLVLLLNITAIVLRARISKKLRG